MVRDEPLRGDGDYVLYWMIGERRARSNFALDRAVAWADALRKPLLVLEALRCDYRWASDRFHQFVIDGMRDNAQAFARARVSYYPYLEPTPRASRGLLETLASRAALVVTDRSPVFDLADLVAAAARRIRGRLEEVDSYGVVPLDAPASVFPTAYAFRRYLQRTLPDFLEQRPASELTARDRRMAGPLPDEVRARWPSADAWWTRDDSLASLPLDHAVGAVETRGGSVAAADRLQAFLQTGLARYAETRAHPDEAVTSGLSPYLHFGHVSSHDVLQAVLDHEAWNPSRLATKASGAREGWWGLTANAEAFLDQVITWRELGGNGTRLARYTEYDTLPVWAQTTLARHASDPRPALYSLETFAAAETHDPLWNAAQRQLAREGVMHNYLRMLWGKKILEWTPTPQDALAVMIDLNNRYALDGRDPNSYSGIFWVLGRYDRPWGPERPVFGTIRYMTSESAARKLRLKTYLERYGPDRLF